MITNTLENGRSKWQILIFINSIVSIIIFSLAVYKVKTLEGKGSGHVTDVRATCLPAMLPYGSEAEDPSEGSVTVSVSHFLLSVNNISSGELEADINNGLIITGSDDSTYELMLCVSCCTKGYDVPDPTRQQFFFQRQLTADEKVKVACLIGEDGVEFGHVFSWVSMMCGKVPTGVVQTIFAIADDDTSTYVLRSWSNDVIDVNLNQFGASYKANFMIRFYDSDMKADEVAGNIIFNSLSVPFNSGIVRVIPEENCQIEFCTEM